MEKNKLEEMALQLIEKEKNTPAVVVEEEQPKIPSNDLSDKVKQTINDNYDKQIKNLKDNKDIDKLMSQIAERKIRADLGNDMYQIISEEQRLELSAYALECEKQKLDYRKNREKNLIKEEVNAEVKAKQIEILKKRYGYMYRENEEFIPSKTYNFCREIANWYNSTSTTFKKIVKGTLKFVLYGTIVYLVCKYGYQALVWLSQNFDINNLN